MKNHFKKIKVVFAMYFIGSVIWILIQYFINRHNMYECYKNIDKIEIGDNVNDALLKMKDGLIYEKIYFKIFKNDKDTINPNCYIEITYPYLDKNDPTSNFPRIYFNTKTGKVTDIKTGMSG